MQGCPILQLADSRGISLYTDDQCIIEWLQSQVPKPVISNMVNKAALYSIDTEL